PVVDALAKTDIPLLVDGAHSPGQDFCHPAKYSMWVASGHKWLGGPNGTGFAYVAPHLVPKLQPVLLGDHYYNFADTDLTRFESKGTSDVVRLLGLEA